MLKLLYIIFTHIVYLMLCPLHLSLWLSFVDCKFIGVGFFFLLLSEPCTIGASIGGFSQR